jgi:hypothetical protein
MLALHFFFCEILKFRERETPGSMVLMVWMDQETWASEDAQISSSTRSGHAMLEYMCGIIRTTVQKVQNIQHKILIEISTSTPLFLDVLGMALTNIGSALYKIQRKIWCSPLHVIVPLVVSVG